MQIMSRKQTILNLIANIISYAVTIGISFILTPFLIEKIGKETYSFYPIANTFLNYMVIVTGALNTIASRFIVQNVVKEDFVAAKKYFNAAFLSESIVGAILTIPMILIIVFVDRFMDVPFNNISAIRLLFATTFASGLVNIISSNLGVATLSKNRIDLRSYRELGAGLLRAGLSLLFYTVFPTSIVYIGLIALLIAIFNVLIQLIYTKKLLPGFIFNKEKIEKRFVSVLIKSTIWTIISAVGNMFLSGMTIVLANIFYGSGVSGTFSIVHTIPGFLNGLITLLVGVYYPQLIHHYSKNDFESMKQTLNKTIVISGGFGAAVISVFLASSISFFSLWVSSENQIELFFLSFLSLLPYLSTAAFWGCHELFVVYNKVKIPALVTLGVGLLNIGIISLLGFLKAPYWTILLATAVLQFGWSGVFFPLYTHKIANIKFKTFYIPFAKILILSLVSFAICFAFSRFFLLNSWLKYILYALIFGPIFLTIIYYALDKNMLADIWTSIKYKIASLFKKRNKQ